MPIDLYFSFCFQSGVFLQFLEHFQSKTSMIPNPTSLISGEGPLPPLSGAALGTISVETLNQYHCYNPDRRLISLFGTVYDVTSSERSYGPDGAYKEYAGHDITLGIAMHKTQEKWLDRFIPMKEKWVATAKGWEGYFSAKYPIAGKLDKWEEDQDSWEALSEEEMEELEKGCTIM